MNPYFKMHGQYIKKMQVTYQVYTWIKHDSSSSKSTHSQVTANVFLCFFCLLWCCYLPPISSGVAVRLYCWSLLLLARRFSLQRFPQLFAAQVAHCLRCTWGAILKPATDLEVGLGRCEIPTLKRLYIKHCIRNSRNLKKHDDIIKLKEHWHTNS